MNILKLFLKMRKFIIVVKATGKLSLNVSQIGSMIGCDKFFFAQNLEGLMHEKTMTCETYEASNHIKICTINGKKDVKFFFRIPKKDRHFIGIDHAKDIDAGKNLNDYLEALIGKEYRRVPTILYGVYDDFLKFLRINYTPYSSASGVLMRESPLKLGVYVKYVGVTFKTLMDMRLLFK